MDKDHGGERYYYRNQGVRVRKYRNVLNLVHLYGDNYFHFLIEVLPRFFLARSLLQRHPDTPILVRSGGPLHLLQLLGIDHVGSLNLHVIQAENELVLATENMYFTLAPRCLHAPEILWRRIRSDFSRNLGERIQGLDQETFRLPLNFVQYLEGASMTAGSRPLIKLVYMSRANSAPRRHLSDEDLLIDSLRRAFQLSQKTSQTLYSELPTPGSHGDNDEEENADTVSEFFSPVETFYRPNDTISPFPISLTVLRGNETLATTITAMAGASIVISPHGAALSNIIFLPNRAYVWEIAPEGYWNPCYLYLTNGLRLRHGLLRAEGRHNSELTLGVKGMEEFLQVLVATVDRLQLQFQAELEKHQGLEEIA